MKKEPLSLTLSKLILVVALIVGIGSVLGVLGYYLTNPKSVFTPMSKTISAVEISKDGKSILNTETKTVIFTIADTQKYLKDSGYAYNPDTFQDTNAKHAGDCFTAAALSNNKDRIVFSTGCLAGDLPQAWVGVYDSRITKTKLDCSGFNALITSAYACVGEENLQNWQKIYFLIGGNGKNFIWSQGDETITYEVDLGLSGMTETRMIDSQTGEFLETKPIEEGFWETEIKDWKTYRNEKYGFEIKYPSLWHILNDTKTGGLAVISTFTQEMYDKYYSTTEAEKLGENYGRIWITYNSNSLEENFEKVNRFMEISARNKGGNPFQIEQFSNDRINIAGVEAYKFYSNGISFFRMEKGENEILIYYLITNKKDIDIIKFEGHFGGQDKEILENYAKKFETIISTFRFIE